MTPKERGYLEDTVGILINYDGESTVNGLKGLIDEARGNLKLSYVGTVSEESGLPVHICYFTEECLDDVWGEDWDDAPYEHNAGIPNTPYLTLLSINVDSARSGYLNSPYSVEDINNGVSTWLMDEGNNELYAGATVNEFIQFMVDSPRGIYI